MNETVLAVIAGLIVGFLFSFLKLPLPAPPVLPGILGIIGIYMGGKAFEYASKYLGTYFK